MNVVRKLETDCRCFGLAVDNDHMLKLCPSAEQCTCHEPSGILIHCSQTDTDRLLRKGRRLAWKSSTAFT